MRADESHAPCGGTALACPPAPWTPPTEKTIETNLPAPLDRLRWSRWHWRTVIALGVTWILDGLEVTLVSAVATVLGEPDTLHLSTSQIGGVASAYLGGAIVGALVFGRLSDRLGRKRLLAPTIFGALVGTGSRTGVMMGYLVGAGLMALAGVLAAIIGVPAKGRSLEEIATLEDGRPAQA